MSVVINTNTAATIAANNLADANRMLQRSLNRLSSGSKIITAADDAGGVAVAARLSGAAVRTQGAIANISSALSFLQQQDSALKTGSKLVQRMNELQMLYRDATKSGPDKDLYETEFLKLRDQYKSAVKDASFNGISMMNDPGELSITINESLTQYKLAKLTADVTDSSGWAISDGGNFAKAVGTAGMTKITANGNLILKVGSLSDVTVALAQNDTMSTVVQKINNSGAAVSASVTVDGYLSLTGKNQGDSIIVQAASDNSVTTDLGLTEYDSAHAAATTYSAGNQTDHSFAEIQSLAKARAKNGADQNVLEYYSELAAASKANFDSAVSRIMDIDVAQESTQLARWNTLVQAGTAMIAQANGSTLSALTLLKG